MTKEKIRSVLESLMFVLGEPVPARTAAELLEVPAADIVKIFRELAEEYEERGSGLRIREMDKAFQLCTNAENDDYIAARYQGPDRCRKRHTLRQSA